MRNSRYPAAMRRADEKEVCESPLETYLHGWKDEGISMTTFLRIRGPRLAVLAAALVGFGATGAMADPYSSFRSIDSRNATTTYGYQPAPGYDRPDFDVVPPPRDEITVFQNAPGSNEPEVLDRTINEFAGEQQRYHNGIFDAIFGR